MAWKIYIRNGKDITPHPGTFKSRSDAEQHWLKLRGNIQGKPIYIQTK